jgi:hypothetical protein
MQDSIPNSAIIENLFLLSEIDPVLLESPNISNNSNLGKLTLRIFSLDQCTQAFLFIERVI